MSVFPNRISHMNTREKLPHGYEVERELIGYHRPHTVTGTPIYQYNLYLNGVKVETDTRKRPLIWAARRRDYG